jgi:ABC-2 type transport system permease protein
VTGAGAPAPSFLRAAGVLARNDLTRLVRDRLSLFFIVVLPVVIILVIGAMSGGYSSQVPIGVVDLDRSDASVHLLQSLQDSGTVSVVTYESDDALRQDVRLQAIAGGLSIPAGYGAALAGGQVAGVDLLTAPKQGTASTLITLVGTVVGREGQAVAAARFASDRTGRDHRELLPLAEAIQVRLHPVPVEVETTGRATLSSSNRYAYTAPSNLVLFVFINSLTGATALVESRRLGVTRRALAAPVTVSAIVAGAGLTRFAVALLQSALILGVGALVFGVDWGNPLAAAALVLTFAALSSGAGLLVGALARKPEQVPAMAIPIAMGLAMLGGCLWPLEIVPSTLRTLGHLTPHAWAMDAWISLSFEGGDLGTIAGSLAVLGIAAALLLTLATWRLGRVLRS